MDGLGSTITVLTIGKKNYPEEGLRLSNGYPATWYTLYYPFSFGDNFILIFRYNFTIIQSPVL